MANPANKLISSLLKDGKSLAELRKEAKTGPNNTEKQQEIHAKAKKLIPELLNELENVQQLPAFFPEKAIPNVLDKIQATIDDLKELDRANTREYEELAKRVSECKSQKPVFAARSSSSSFGDSTSGDSTQLEGLTVDGIPQQDQFESLGLEEKKCLFCFCLFSAEMEVKKREPIHLWVALGLVAGPSEGFEMLKKLVAGRFIKQTIRNKRLCNRYKMNHNVRSMVVEALKIKFAADNSLQIMDQSRQRQNQQEQHQNEQQPPPLGTLVLNISEDTIEATTFERISKIKNNVKVLHLGSWLHDFERYIVVDVEVLNGLTKYTGHITFLSLAGISGIVELPNSVYKLETLKVLDLRGCPNLESLSEGIDSLRQLTHLDLSDCYLLDRIPIGITSLTELRVLKGFVINPDNTLQVEDGSGISGHVNENKKVVGNTFMSSASFGELRALENLIKLTIRTRRKNFPTSDDFDTLCAMNSLENLKVTWVWDSADVPIVSVSGRFPASLKKLALQATPVNTMLRLLKLISNETQNSIQKLYIIGGNLRHFGSEEHKFRHVQKVRLRYLPDLHIDWESFRKFFPDLTCVERFECPNVVYFPNRFMGNQTSI